ncbi:MAG: NTP transferase domain-containing protein, partial [Dehalococcoidia bacterium]
MKALILAAGRGSRVAATADSKPLLRVMGLPLIERTIATAHRAGISEFYVVIGHNADCLDEALLDISRRRRLPLTVLPSQDWAEGNGASLLAARDLLHDEFVLLMADHVVEESVIRSLLDDGLAGAAVRLAADFGVESASWVDPEDVTRVRTKGDRIVDIGKGLEQYDAYDTGVFLCSPAIFAAAAQSRRHGDASVSGALRELARSGRAKVTDVSGLAWIDVDTARDAGNAKTLVAASLAKPRDGWVSRVLNRPLSSRIFTPLLLRLFPAITPNQVSALSLAAAAAAMLAFFFRQPIVGGAAIYLASVLDGSDGEVARLKRLESPFGKFFDAVLDRYADSLILFGMLYFSATASANAHLFGDAWMPLIFVVGMLALAGNWMVSYTSAKAATDLGYGYRGRLIATGRGRDLRLLLLTLGGILAWTHPLTVFAALAVVALLTNAIVLRRLFLSWTHAQGATELADVDAVIYDFDGIVVNSMPFLTQTATELITAHYAVSQSLARERYLASSGVDFATQIEEMFPGHPLNPVVVTAFEKRKHAAASG